MISHKSRTAAVTLALAAAALAAGLDAPVARAQDWSYDRFERVPGPHNWGPRCMERITTRGRAGVKFFSNKGKRNGKERAVENWQEQVAAEFGPQFANWGRSRGQQLDCSTHGLKVTCTASAHPCR
jgi:hypothetical protein